MKGELDLNRFVLGWLAIPLLLALGLAGCGGDDSASKSSGTTVAEPGAVAGTQLAGVKTFLGQHTDRLSGFTEEFKGLAKRYHELAATEELRSQAALGAGERTRWSRCCGR